MNTVQRIFKNTVSLLFAKIINGLLSFTIIIYLARILRPEYFGKISFALAIITYFTIIANLGLPVLGTREIAKDKTTLNEYPGGIVSIRICFAFISFLLLLLLVFFLNEPKQIKYLILIYGIGVIPSAFLLDWVFQGVEKMEYIGLSQILSIIIYTVLIFLLVKSHNQILLVPCCNIISNILAVLMLFVIFQKNFGKIKLNFKPILWKKLIKAAIPLAGASFMVQIVNNMDTIMLGFLKTYKEVGFYNAAYKIICMLIMIFAAYFDTIYPVISKYHKESMENLKKFQYLNIKLIVILTLPIALGGTLFAKPIMELIYGSNYNQGVIALRILIWAFFLWSINNVYVRGLLGCEKENIFFIILIIQAVSNVLLNFALIPFMGIAGAGIATVTAETIGLILYFKEFNKILKTPLFTHLFKPLIASLLMSLTAYLMLTKLSLNIILIALIAAIVYFVFLYLIKGVTTESLLLIQNAILKNRKGKYL